MKLNLSQLKKLGKQLLDEIDNKNKQYKKIEKDFKIILDRTDKAKDIFIQSQKDLNEKIILNQIAKLNISAADI